MLTYPWTAQVQQPMILLGTSLGSAIAVHFAREHPECVRAMVMSGPQVYVVSAALLAVPDSSEYFVRISAPARNAVAADPFMHLQAIGSSRSGQIVHGAVTVLPQYAGWHRNDAESA